MKYLKIAVIFLIILNLLMFLENRKILAENQEISQKLADLEIEKETILITNDKLYDKIAEPETFGETETTK